MIEQFLFVGEGEDWVGRGFVSMDGLFWGFGWVAVLWVFGDGKRERRFTGVVHDLGEPFQSLLIRLNAEREGEELVCDIHDSRML